MKINYNELSHNFSKSHLISKKLGTSFTMKIVLKSVNVIEENAAENVVPVRLLWNCVFSINFLLAILIGHDCTQGMH